MENQNIEPQVSPIRQYNAGETVVPQQPTIPVSFIAPTPENIEQNIATGTPERIESEYVSLKQQVSQVPRSGHGSGWTILAKFRSNNGYVYGKNLYMAGLIFAIFILFATGGLYIFNKSKPSDAKSYISEITDQSVELDNSKTDSVSPRQLQAVGDEKKIVMRGDIIGTQNISLFGNGTLGRFKLGQLSKDQVYTLPDSSGTVCLDSNNCAYATSDNVVSSIAGIKGVIGIGGGLSIQGSTLIATSGVITTVGGVSGNIALGDGLSVSGSTLSASQTLVNNLKGSVNIQGQANRINVISSGNYITITTPQDIGTTSSPLFQTVALTATGMQGGNAICDASNNCGYAGGASSFVQNGNSFGALAVLGTNDLNNLSIETNNIERLTVDTNGTVTIGGVSPSTGGQGKLYIPYVAGDDGYNPGLFASKIGVVIGDISLASSDVTPLGLYTNNAVGLEVASGSNDGIYAYSGASGFSAVSGLNFQAGGMGVSGYGDFLGTGNGYGVYASSADSYALYSQSSNSTSGFFQAKTSCGLFGCFDVNASPTLVVKQLGALTANLQEWQDSTGTILGSVSSAGVLTLQTAGAATIIANPTAGLISMGGNNGITNSIDVTGGGNGVARLCLDENGSTCNTGVSLQYDGVANRFDILTASGSISAGNERLSIARDTGNVGIGTTSPGTSRFVVDNQLNTGNIFVLQDNGSVVLSVADGGAITLQNTVDSTDAFRVMDLDGGNPVLSVDTTNERVGIGTATPSETLQVVGTLDVSGHVAIGNFASVDDTSLWQPVSTYSSVLTIEEEVTDHTAQYINGITNNLLLSPTASTSGEYTASFSSVQTLINSPYDFTGTITASTAYARNYADGTVSTMYGTTTGVIQDSFSDGTMDAAIGISVTNTLQGSGDVGILVGGFITNNLQGTGIVSQAVGLAVINDGGTNNVIDNYGIYVSTNTMGDNDYGVAIGTADTQTLWISNDADNITSNAGIAFGTSMDTNLYRSAVNRLQTDGSFIVQTNIGVNNTTAPNRVSVNTLTTADPNAELAVSTGADSKKGVVVQGVVGQTANLQEWQSSTGTVLAYITSTGYLSVKGAFIDGDIQIDGHIMGYNQSGSTTVAAGGAAGAGSTVSMLGSDIAGYVSITTGTGATSGVLATITFSASYSGGFAGPAITLTPKNGNGPTIQYFANSSNLGSFTIDTNNVPADGTVYEYYYQVIQFDNTDS